MSDRAVAMNNMVIDHQETQRDSVNFTKLATELAETGKNFYSRGWVLGTSGNFSAVTSWQPLRLAISPTGLDKGSLTAAHFLEIDGACNVIRGDGQPSTETMLPSCNHRLYECGRSFTYPLRVEYGAFEYACAAGRCRN